MMVRNLASLSHRQVVTLPLEVVPISLPASACFELLGWQELEQMMGAHSIMQHLGFELPTCRTLGRPAQVQHLTVVLLSHCSPSFTLHWKN